jgi:hypothetical protein
MGEGFFVSNMALLELGQETVQTMLLVDIVF